MVAALLLPGSALLRRREGVDALAWGAALAIIVLGAVSLTRFFLLLPPTAARAAGPAALLLAVASVFLLARWVRAPRPHGLPAHVPSGLVPAILGVALVTLGLEAVLPHYVDTKFYYDWWMHFDLANFYRDPTGFDRLYLDGGSITARTPLYNLLGALALTVFGDRFAVFQVMTAALGWLWILPTVLVARRLGLARTTPIIAVLGLSPLILHSHTYAWPKGLVAFFALMALERFLALQQQPFGEGGPLAVKLGLLCGATVMAHAGFVGYLLPLAAILAWDVACRRREWTSGAAAAATAVAVVLPWYAWAATQYSWRQALFGYPRFPYTSVAAWLGDHWYTLVSSLLPVDAPIALLTGALDAHQAYALTYLGTAGGLLGIGFLLWALARNMRRRSRVAGPHAGPVLAFAATGILVATALLQPLVRDNADAVFIPALVVLALLVFRSAPLSRRHLFLALAEIALVQAVVLPWLWSPASNTQGNAELAAAHGIRFLAPGVWPVGLLLLASGAALCLRGVAPALRREMGARPGVASLGRTAAGPTPP
jgi:hypothetical protein